MSDGETPSLSELTADHEGCSAVYSAIISALIKTLIEKKTLSQDEVGLTLAAAARQFSVMTLSVEAREAGNLLFRALAGLIK